MDNDYVCPRGTSITRSDIAMYFLTSEVFPDDSGLPSSSNRRFSMVSTHLVEERLIDHDRKMLRRRLITPEIFSRMYPKNNPDPSLPNIRCKSCMKIAREYRPDAEAHAVRIAHSDLLARLYSKVLHKDIPDFP
ncbi:MAG TPA: hypothetical protein VJB87_01185 [Candidatus Nanoarchaeia archaeon]|nr:hypothetical protein [Candidatus Nanoarchaeia archaeon]